MRVKTVWFKKDESKSPEEIAGVIAATVWRVADKAMDNLSRADYDIVTPERGFKLIAELAAFLLHLSDRLLHGRVADAQRAALIQAAGKRLAEIMEQNVRAVVGQDGYDYQSDFIGMLNQRSDDYATLDFPAGEPGFPVLRYLGNRVREVMGERDQPWIVDQIMEIEAPEAIDTVKRAVNGLLDPKAAKRTKPSRIGQ